MAKAPIAPSPVRPQFAARSSIARFGLIALATDLVSEGDLFRLLPNEGVAMHVARIAYQNPTTPDNLRKMAPRLSATAELLAPVARLRRSITAAPRLGGDRRGAGRDHRLP
ncbi:MAG: ectoine utilization protein EutA, partial [Rhizobiales bacterium]|nr:ectoine utilization protein EutA [Hyphomicrobiales bacterium]